MARGRLRSAPGPVSAEPRYGIDGKEITGGYVMLEERLEVMPSTLWRFPNDSVRRELYDLVGDTGQERADSFGKSGKFLPHSPNATSVFNPLLAAQVVLGYTHPGMTIIDPFGGGGTRAVISAYLDRRYVGVEVRATEARRVQDRLHELGLDDRAEIIRADAVKHAWPPASADALLTCPPYWNLERYSQLKADLSNAPSYGTFLSLLNRVIRRSYPALRDTPSTGWSVWVVGEFRDPRTDELLDFPGDVVRLHREAGFYLYDRAVVDRNNGLALQRVRSFDASRKLVRVHEHVLIFKTGRGALG